MKLNVTDVQTQDTITFKGSGLISPQGPRLKSNSSQTRNRHAKEEILLKTQ